MRRFLGLRAYGSAIGGFAIVDTFTDGSVGAYVTHYSQARDLETVSPCGGGNSEKEALIDLASQLRDMADAIDKLAKRND